MAYEEEIKIAIADRETAEDELVKAGFSVDH